MNRLRVPAVTATALAMALAPAAVAHAGGGSDETAITPVATGLDGPRQLSPYADGRLVVAESDSGEVSSVDPWSGEVRTLVGGLASPQGVDYAHGLLFVATGGPPPPGESGAAPTTPADAAVASLLVVTPDGTVLRTIDLLAYELAHNPDGQVQFVDGQPVDALSNPFAVLAQRHRVLVADAGANDVLSVNLWTGEISTFFVPPTVTDVPACQGPDANANPGTQGCDPVPTGVEEGPDGLIYVSTLGAEAPDASRVYVLTPDGKKVVRVIDGLTGVAGLAVGRDGAVYASELLEGAPEGDQPPPGFDPSTVGQVVRIDCDGDRTYSQVTMPTGLVARHGALFASAWSIAGELGMPSAGQVVRVGPGSFTAAPAA